LTTLPADYQLALLNSGGTVLQSSTKAGTTSESINATVTPGVYYARVYPKNNQAFNAGNCYTLRVQTGTASKNADAVVQTLSNKFSVWPNPAGNTVNVLFNAKAGGNVSVFIMNQTGSVVVSKILQVNEGENTRKLDVGNLSNGIYFIKLQTGSFIQIDKLVIAK
jgi:Tol biopolymer transport system component